MPTRNLSTEERYRVILRIGHVLNSSLDMDVVLGRVATELESLFPLDHVALLIVNPDGKTYTWTNITRGGETVDLPGRDVPVKGGALGWLMEHRDEPYLIYHDLQEERPFAEDEIVFKRGIRSGIRVPLVIQDKVFGELAVASTEPGQFTSEMGEFLVQVAPHIATAVANARAYRQLDDLRETHFNEALCLREELKTVHNFENLIGNSRAISAVKDMIRRVAPSEATVLILGETGTGKELVARAIHNLSQRKDRVLVKVNCAALQDTLLLSELFGHERGAFTGAIERRIGRFELAHKGTIFLDEIGEISMEAQVKILRVMQEREFERVGGTQTQRVDVRIIAATNRDLEAEVQEGKFRSDLYFRLNVIPLHVPPLRERKEDIPYLVEYFIRKHAPRMNPRVRGVDRNAMDRLVRYDWPGNIRELENVVERGLVLGTEEILLFDKQRLGDIPEKEGEEELTSLEEYERRYILRVLERTGGIVSGERGAARILSVKPTTLQSRMKKLGIRQNGRSRKAQIAGKA
ncbi:MAG: sigma 54-interacting transcriptional regulator [bacterium]|nr:sigma 54-interacting transcriptional regulator [bacterium]